MESQILYSYLSSESLNEGSSIEESDQSLKDFAGSTFMELPLAEQVRNYINQFKAMEDEQLLREFLRCNKSNVTKNILCQFKYFIEEAGDQIVLESISEERTLVQIRKEFHNFSRAKKYNQSYLVSILKSKRFNAQFAYFLIYYTEDWIVGSNIKNIQDHLLCIIFLQRCEKDANLVDKIIKYKKKKKID